MLAQAEEGHGMAATTRTRRGKGEFFTEAFVGSLAVPIPSFWASFFHNTDRTNFCCFKSPGLWSFIVAALGN